MLRPVSMQLDDIPIPPVVRGQIAQWHAAIQAFHDRWDRELIEMFVASDYELVYQALCWITRNNEAVGRHFCEWGCGFGCVASLASSLGWDAIGIEAEQPLIDEAHFWVDRWGHPVQLVRADFLPRGAARLAEDYSFPSLGHEQLPNAYDVIDLEVDDFALVFAYPWPGEDQFFEAVFDRYGQRDGLLLLFRGPNDLVLKRKVR
jgi:hypothetical protein